MRHIVVVGGGIAGLTAAWRLAARGHDVTVLESGGRVGGRARSVSLDGLPIDTGAAFVAGFYREVLRLVDEAGLADRLVPFSLAASINRAGRPRQISPLPTLITGGLLSPPGMLRLLGGALTLIPRWRRLDLDDLVAADVYDTASAHDWARATLGPEAADYLIAPILRGVVHWDSRTTSRAVLFTMLKAAVLHRSAARLDCGMDMLCRRLAARARVVLDAPVQRITPAGAGWAVLHTIAGRPATIDADAVVCAVPAAGAGALVDGLSAESRAFLSSIAYSSTAVAVLRREASATALTGAVFPAPVEEDTIAGITPYRPPGAAGPSAFVRVALSSKAYAAVRHLPDAELAEWIRTAAGAVPGVGEALRGAEVADLVRWPFALPVFDVGHLRKLRSWRGRAPDLPHLAFAGDYLEGPYLEGAARSGAQAAERIAAWAG